MATFDKDGDGKLLDDGARMGAQGLGALMGFGGASLGAMGAAAGTAGAAVGAGIAGIGGAIFAAGLGGEMVPGLQIPATAALALGGAMTAGGLGLGALSVIGGAGAGVAGGGLALLGAGVGTVGADAAEIGGDFLSDQLFGPAIAPGTPGGPSLGDVLGVD